MKRDLTAEAAEYSDSSAVIRCKLSPGVTAGWVPSRFLIEDALTLPPREEIEIAIEVAHRLGRKPSARWLDYAGQSLPVALRVAAAGLVSDGSPLFEVKSPDRRVMRDALDWLAASTAAQATVNALSDAREGARRAATRAGDQDPLALSASSCVMLTRDHGQEFAASLIFDQRPSTLSGALASRTTGGRLVTFGSSVSAREGAARAQITDARESVWFTSDEREFDLVLRDTSCVPVVPSHRDVTYALKHATKSSVTKLMTVGKRYAFSASSPSDAKQSFSSIASLRAPVAECVAVLDFACRPMSLSICAGEAREDEKLCDIRELEQIDHSTATALLFN